jgi:hypothetical protein
VVDITKHGRDRLAQRGISVQELEYALTHQIPGRRSPGLPGSIWVCGYATGGRILKVCVATDDEDRVITAAWPDE